MFFLDPCADLVRVLCCRYLNFHNVDMPAHGSFNDEKTYTDI